jgi:hypothetical protein
MGRDEFEHLKSGVIRRRTKRLLGLFIDGVGLDRATRRLERKVDLGRLVAGICVGLKPEVARYYTLIPYEDDARQFAFLDAVERAGLEVVVKRLPPKGVKRQVSMDVHIASDLISYAYGYFEAANQEKVKESSLRTGTDDTIISGPCTKNGEPIAAPAPAKPNGDGSIRRIATVICPSREITYAIYMAHTLGVETSLADFGLYGSSDGWKGVDRWVDLSTSETIWRE